MKFLSYFSTICCLYLFTFVISSFQVLQPSLQSTAFDQFVHKFNKTYSQEQYLKRKQIFFHNVQIIQASDCQSCGINFFADWMLQQTDNLRTVKKSVNKNKIGATSNHRSENQGRLLLENLPSSFDWRNQANFTSVKNQGYCGASWAFSAAAFFQTDSIINGLTNSSINLSEQFLITCNRQNQGCNRGYIDTSMDLIMQVGGVPYQSKYPYRPAKTQAANICFQTQLFKVQNKMRISYYDIVNPQTIEKLILKKPVNIGVCGADLLHYYPASNQTGARTLKCKPSNRIIDHAVLLIGYTQTQWIIRNQWGTGWGINGYAYISKKTSEDCCIGQQMYSTGQVTQTCSVANCLTCVQNDTCYKCNKGYYVQHNQTTGVQTCMPCLQANCFQCYNYFGTCRQCLVGFALNISSGKCIVSTITNCNLLSGTFCNQCHRGYKLSASRLICSVYCAVRNCNLCLQESCTECKSGYTLNKVTINGQATQKCVLNPCNVGNCTLCDANGACVLCYGTFALVNGTCSNTCNLVQCIRCTTGSTTCTQCVEGKSWNTTARACQFMAATPNCRTHNTTACTACKTGYSFNTARTLCNQVCQNTTCSNCSKSDTGICYNCANGYYLVTTDYQFYCLPFPCTLPNCTVCSADGSTCVVCVSSFHVWNSTAMRCEIQCYIPNCSICLPTDTKCNTCNTGYAVIYQTRLCIISTLPKCPMVYLYSDGSFDCQTCAANYIIAADYKSCTIYCDDPMCQVCFEDDFNVCYQCYEGFSIQFQNGKSMCLKTVPVMQGCNSITQNQTYCYSCSKYYYRDNKGKCVLNKLNCTQGCQYCTPPDYTQGYACRCQNGYTLDKISRTCLQTNPLSNNCTVISDWKNGTFYCQQCPTGDKVSLDSKSCVAGCVLANCKTCASSNNTQCSVCDSGYYVDISLKCIKCLPQNCEICTGIKCQACSRGYEINPKGDTCTKIQCLPTFYFDGYNCFCPSGTYATTTACLSCKQQNCVLCSQNECFSCKDGFYLNQSQCFSCLFNCKSCTSNSSCKQCNPGYFYQGTTGRCLSLQSQGRAYLAIQNSTVQCPAGCISCSSSGICLKCASSYTLSNSTCIPCQGNCQNCLSSQPSKCTSCPQGYIYQQYYTCSKCSDLNCIDCSLGIDACISCIHGYYVKNGTCSTCTLNDCLKCSSSVKCIQCASGYTLDSNSTCIPCIGDCRACSASNLTECIVICQPNEIKINQTCYSCPLNCKSCTDRTTCVQCVQSYVLRDSICKKKCKEGCFQCDQQNVNTCFKCFNGYFLSADGTCIPNLNCIQDSTCTLCPVSYILIDSNCLMCDYNPVCLQCGNGNPQQCIQCVDGYYIQNKVCTKCQQKCKTCQQVDKCKQCIDGYYLNSGQTLGQCLKCDDNCLTCASASTKCTSCNTSLVLAPNDKCLSPEKVFSQIRLNCAVSQFISSAHKVTSDIVTLLGSTFNGRVSCKRFRQGSTIAGMQISVPSGMTSQQVQTLFSQVISAASSLGGIPLISIQKVEIVFVGQRRTQQGDSKNLIIILAVVIPSVIIIFAVFGYLMRSRIFSVNNAIQNESQDVLREKQIQEKMKLKSKLAPLPQHSPTKNTDKNSLSNAFNDTNLTFLNQESHQNLGETRLISKDEVIHSFEQQNKVQSIFGQNEPNIRKQSSTIKISQKKDVILPPLKNNQSKNKLSNQIRNRLESNDSIRNDEKNNNVKLQQQIISLDEDTRRELNNNIKVQNNVKQLIAKKQGVVIVDLIQNQN